MFCKIFFMRFRLLDLLVAIVLHVGFSLPINAMESQLKLTRRQFRHLDTRDLNRYLSNLESLESLALDFKSELEDDGNVDSIINLDLLKRLLSIFPDKALSKLDHLDLNFADGRYTKTDSDAIKILVSLLEKSRGFVSLSLNLRRHNMGPDNLKAIVRALTKKVEKLTTLDLNLINNNIGDDNDAISNLIELLMPSVNLRVLRLRIERNDFSDNAAIALAKLLKARAGSLVDVVLDFSYGYGDGREMSNDEAIALASFTRSGVRLNLIMNYMHIFDDGMLALMRAVVKLAKNNLVELGWRFSCKHLSEVKLVEASKLLRSVTKLTIKISDVISWSLVSRAYLLLYPPSIYVSAIDL